MLVVQYERRDSVYKKRRKIGQVRDGEREASLILSSCVGSCVCVCVAKQYLAQFTISCFLSFLVAAFRTGGRGHFR